MTFQACTEMVMPLTCSNESMFPPSAFEYKEFADECTRKYGVMPRPHWITTEFGGSVSLLSSIFPPFQMLFFIRENMSKISYNSPKNKNLWDLLSEICPSRESNKCWRDQPATLFSPMECKIHGAEAGQSINFFSLLQ